MPDLVDLYSDTHTLPTPSMREAMYAAEVGDDVNHEDPTVNRLEALAAEMVAKETSVFVPSGTMANLASLLAATKPQDEIILDRNSHVYNSEAAGFAAVAGVSPWFLNGVNGILDVEIIQNGLRLPNEHYPKPRVIWVENTHNYHGGTFYTPSALAEIRGFADSRGLHIHMDGARVFNAAVGAGCDVRDMTRHVDSVSFCLSKGLGAPVGSIIAGSADFIREARRKRKMLGGGMRQAGIIAAAGIVALQEGPARLAEDHRNARRLAEGIASLPGVAVPLMPVTNIVYVKIDPGLTTGPELQKTLLANGLKVSVSGIDRVRMVTYHQITRAMIDRAVEVFASTVEQLRSRTLVAVG